MTVVLVPVTFQAPKELNEVRVAIVKLIKDIRAGKDVGTLVAENLSTLVAAVGGVDKLPEEFKSEMARSLETTGHMGGEIAGALLS